MLFLGKWGKLVNPFDGLSMLHDFPTSQLMLIRQSPSRNSLRQVKVSRSHSRASLNWQYETPPPYRSLGWGGNGCVNTAVAMETAELPHLLLHPSCWPSLRTLSGPLEPSEGSQAPRRCSFAVPASAADWRAVWMIAATSKRVARAALRQLQELNGLKSSGGSSGGDPETLASLKSLVSRAKFSLEISPIYIQWISPWDE